MNTFARILNTPAEARPVHTPEEQEALRAEADMATRIRSHKINCALLAKINAAKASGISAKGIQLTESEVEAALAGNPTEKEAADLRAISGIISF